MPLLNGTLFADDSTQSDSAFDYSIDFQCVHSFNKASTCARGRFKFRSSEHTGDTWQKSHAAMSNVVRRGVKLLLLSENDASSGILLQLI